MPAIDPRLLNSVIFLYASEQNARDGTASGGSGFLVSVPSRLDANWAYVYAVTNRHVLDGGFHVIRVNTADGGTRAITTEAGDWTFAAEDDLAVSPFPVHDNIQWDSIGTEAFLPETPDATGLFAFGPGDEAVLLGRFVRHDGRQRNKPVARFGNISMMSDAEEPIDLGDGRHQTAILVECRSLSGFSGSPVFGFLHTQRAKGGTLLGAAARPILLGVDCAHVPFWSRIYERQARVDPIENMWVEINSGIAVVIPAWRLMALLNEPHLARERDRNDQTLPRNPQ
jgi:hypothetical protein